MIANKEVWSIISNFSSTAQIDVIPVTTFPASSRRAIMESVNIPELVGRLGREEDAVRKMAVFKLQTNIGDPSFAEVFIAEGGLTKLRYLTLHASGNTLAYSLTSFSRLLEVDKGWEYINQDLVERVVYSWPSQQSSLILWCR